jgi:hypothetical protein
MILMKFLRRKQTLNIDTYIVEKCVSLALHEKLAYHSLFLLNETSYELAYLVV